MNAQLPETQAVEPPADAVEETDPRSALEGRFRTGASWFYWVAGLSLVNSVVVLFGGEWGFIFGLGFTQVVDAVASVLIEESPDAAFAMRAGALAVNVFIVGVVLLMGYLAHQRQQWVFVVGLVLYTVDALLFLVAGDFLSLAFHGWVFFAVTSGLLACRKLAALEAPPAEQAFSPA